MVERIEVIAKKMNTLNEQYRSGAISADDATRDYMYTTQIKYEAKQE